MREVTVHLEIVKATTRTIRFLGITIKTVMDIYVKDILFKTVKVDKKGNWEKIWNEVYDHKFTYYITVQDAYNKLCENYWVNISCGHPHTSLEPIAISANSYTKPWLLVISDMKDKTIIHQEEMYANNASQLIFNAYHKLIMNG